LLIFLIEEVAVLFLSWFVCLIKMAEHRCSARITDY